MSLGGLDLRHASEHLNPGRRRTEESAVARPVTDPLVVIESELLAGHLELWVSEGRAR